MCHTPATEPDCFCPLPSSVEIARELRAQLTANNLIFAFVKGVLQRSRASRVLLVRKHENTFSVECEARCSEGQIVMHPQRPLSSSEREREHEFRKVLSTQKTLIAHNGKVSSDSLARDCLSPSLEGLIAFVPLADLDRAEQLLYIEMLNPSSDLDQILVSDLQLLASNMNVCARNIGLREQISLGERKREDFENRLRAQDGTLSMVQGLSRTGFWLWNLNTRELKASPECLYLYDIPYTNRLSYVELTARIHPDDLPALDRAIETAAQNGVILKVECRVFAQDGSLRALLLEGYPDPNYPDTSEYVGVAIDVTERRCAEEALQATQAELYRALRFATLGELAASIIHEINQPLTGVMTNAEVCLSWLSRDVPDIEQARNAALRATRDAERAANTVRGLRSLASKQEFAKLPVEIDEAVREVTLLLRGDLERSSINLSVELASDRPVYGDRVQLQQVLINLMRNSIEALASVVDRPRQLLITAKPAGGEMAEISVCDNGVGFSVQTAERMCDPLFTTKSGGMGMGLSVSRTIIEAHGGKLSASWTAEEGAVLTFSVPFAKRS
jgi:signal transduction histidine kinase